MLLASIWSWTVTALSSCLFCSLVLSSLSQWLAKSKKKKKKERKKNSPELPEKDSGSQEPLLSWSLSLWGLHLYPQEQLASPSNLSLNLHLRLLTSSPALCRTKSLSIPASQLTASSLSSPSLSGLLLRRAARSSWHPLEFSASCPLSLQLGRDAMWSDSQVIYPRRWFCPGFAVCGKAHWHSSLQFLRSWNRSPPQRQSVYFGQFCC